MSTTAPLQTLRDHRALLLGCEAVGWFHMSGKAHPDFLRGHGGESNSYDFKNWFSVLNPDWDSQLSWLASSFSSLSWPSTLTEFLTHFDTGQSRQSTVGLLQAAHAMASGIEKNHPKATSGYLAQDVTHIWRASPFGHCERNLLLDPPLAMQVGGPESIVDEVARVLDELSQLHSSSCADVASWARWRDRSIGGRSLLRRAFLDTIAETRVPNNDVTLWDQSYVTAALFKSAVAGALLAGNTEWQSLRSNTRWRVLTVGVGVRHYEARAVRIGDWTGARTAIDGFFDDVCGLVEVDLGLGALVYRDSEMLAFTFPGLRYDATLADSKGSLDDTNAASLEAALNNDIDQLAASLDGPPITTLSSSTRSFIAMAAELRKAREAVRVPLHRSWRIAPAMRNDQNDRAVEVTDGHTCPVCLVRRNGRRNDKQAPCAVCRERRRGRLRAWLADEVEQDTIWISEVADHNDRVALITFSLGIDDWIDGRAVDSLRAQSLADWRDHNPVLGNGTNPVAPARPMASLTADLETRVASFNKSDPLLKSLQDGFQHEQSWEDFFHKVVEDRSDARPKWSHLTGAQRADWLAHQLFRKNAAPGRVHRFWRTAEGFFQRLLAAIRERASAHDNRWRVRRLVVKANRATPTDRETLHGLWRGAPLGLVYRQASGDFVTITNLARCFSPAETSLALQGESFEVTSDDQRVPVQITIAGVKERHEHLGVYQPTIPLEIGPRRFRVLVPLDVADDVVRVAAARWEEQFARVWTRLPLRVGIIAFPRMTPFQAVIEAARNVEDDLDAEDETWRVVEAKRRDGVACVRWVRPDGEPELTCTPVRLPDGREDAHYSYLAVEDPRTRAPRDFQHPHGQVYRHVADLRSGDGAHVKPSRFASVFLDSTARRFESGQVCYLSEVRQRQAVWALVRDYAPSMSALRGAVGTIEDARERWLSQALASPGQETWLCFVRAVLHDQLEVRGAALDTLVDAARTGLLLRALRWQLQVLKQNVEPDDDHE